MLKYAIDDGAVGWAINEDVQHLVFKHATDGFYLRFSEVLCYRLVHGIAFNERMSLILIRLEEDSPTVIGKVKIDYDKAGDWVSNLLIKDLEANSHKTSADTQDYLITLSGISNS